MAEPRDEDRLSQEIEAEIADHLALAASRLEREGLPSGEARERATRQFGEINSLRRRLWWIRRGDEIMWKIAGAAFIVVLSAGAALMGYEIWRQLRAADNRIVELTAELQSLHETQRELLAKEEQSPILRVTGKAFLGDPSQPAADAAVQICRMPEGGVPSSSGQIIPVRSLTTDAQGLFDSGPLPPGDYYALAKLLHPPDIGQSNTYYAQSRPYYLYPGMGPSEPANLDVQLHYGEIFFEASRKLPFFVKREPPAEKNRSGFTIGDRAAIILDVNLQRDGAMKIPWTPTRPEPEQWPILGARNERTSWNLSADDFPFRLIVPAGKYHASVQVFTNRADENQYRSVQVEKVEILASAHPNAERRAEGDALGEIAISPGQKVHVRFAVPDDYEVDLRKLMDEKRDWYQTSERWPDGEHKPKNNEFMRKQPLPLTIQPFSK